MVCVKFTSARIIQAIAACHKRLNTGEFIGLDMVTITIPLDVAHCSYHLVYG